MSNATMIQAVLVIKPEHEQAAVSVLHRFIQEVDGDPEDYTIDVNNGRLKFTLDAYADLTEEIDRLADQLGQFVAEPGVIEFSEEDVAPGNATSYFWVAADDLGKKQARIRFGIDLLRQTIQPDDFQDGAFETFAKALQGSIKGAQEVQKPAFDLLPQSCYVADLLSAAQDALPMLHGPIRQQLENAVRGFEKNTVVTSWGIDDFGSDDGSVHQVMSDAERIKALALLQKDYKVPDEDWRALESAADEVIQASFKCGPNRYLKVTMQNAKVHYVPVDRVMSVIEDRHEHIDDAVERVLDDEGVDTEGGFTVEVDHHYDVDGNPID